MVGEFLRDGDDEPTKIVTVDLPPGWDYAWYADANTLAFGSHLDGPGRVRALDALQSEWRKAHLHLVADEVEDCPRAG